MGDRRRLAPIVALALITSMVAGRAPVLAQPAGGGSGSDIEMEGDTPPASGSSAAPAQPVKDPNVAKKWLTAAQQLMQRADQLQKSGKADEAKAQYENAITAYAKAMIAGDDPSVTISLAVAEEKAGRPDDAYRHLKGLISPQKAAKPDVQKKAQAKLDELSAKVGTVTLTVKPDGTTVSLGDKQLGETPMSEPLVLAPGTYKLSFTAAGFQSKTAEIRVEAGSESERRITLEPAKVVPRPPHEVEPEPEPSAPTGPTKPDMLPLYISGGAAAGLVVIATITGIAAIENHGTFTDPKTLPLDRLDAQDNGRTYAHITDICLVGALGAAAFGGYWYWYKFRPQHEKFQAQGHAKLDVVPWVQPQAGGVFAVGSF